MGHLRPVLAARYTLDRRYSDFPDSFTRSVPGNRASGTMHILGNPFGPGPGPGVPRRLDRGYRQRLVITPVGFGNGSHADIPTGV